MKLSLSVRIAEEFLSKERARIPLLELTQLARQTGYDALCMRASQVGVQSSADQQQLAATVIHDAGLSVSMVTGDFAIVYNNEQGPACLRNIEPYLQLASTLGAKLIRVALKTEADIEWAQRAADAAAKRELQLVHQCHTLSLFETVDGIEHALRRIDRPNFGLIYEPANLEICGQDYGPQTILRLAPWIKNVYLQNQRLRADGDVTLDTWCRGPIAFDLIPIHTEGFIDFETVFAGLAEIGYRGPITAHQSGFGDQPLEQTAAETANYLKGLKHAW
jgi:sugar phosphate isomerase/epimerase